MRQARYLASAAVLLCLLPGARAEAPQAEPGSQELYRAALQSIAEGRKDDASATLRDVIDKEPLHAGAWLDLALIQCALGHAAEAERLFKEIIARFAPPEGILDLIAQARAAGCAEWKPHSQFGLSMGRGISQNVNQGASSSTYSASEGGVQVELPLLPDFLPKHDQYSLLNADYLREVSGNGTVAFAQFMGRRYDSLHQYNSGALFAGVEKPWRFGRWTVRGTGTVGLMTLGGSLYQRHMQLQARIGPPLPLPESWQMHLQASATRMAYLTLDNFNSNTGELRSQLTYRGGGQFASLSAGYLYDHATGQRPGGDRSGWLFSGLWRRSLGVLGAGELGYTRQNWNGREAYAPGFIDVTRRQVNQVLRATLSYPITRGHVLQIDARAVRNRENIAIFQYNDRQLQISWVWQGL